MNTKRNTKYLIQDSQKPVLESTMYTPYNNKQVACELEAN
jgi:hypothetical protein